MLKFHEGLAALVLFVGLSLSATAAYADNGKVTLTNPEGETEQQVEPAAAGFSSLEELLDASGLAYRKMENDTFRITYEADGEVSVITAWEVTMYNDTNGNPVKVVYIYSWLLDFPEGFQPTVELYHAVREKNLDITVGRILMNDYGLLFSSDFWLTTATLDVLYDELYLAHIDRGAFANMFEPFVTAAEDELN